MTNKTVDAGLDAKALVAAQEAATEMALDGGVPVPDYVQGIITAYLEYSDEQDPAGRIEAALSSQHAEAVADRRPDAYQWFKDGKWVECSEFVAKGWGDELSPDTRALYASPVPADAGEPGIKALSWRDEAIPPAGECLASTAVGLYCIPLGRAQFVLRFRDKDELGHFATLEAAKAAAQADYEARIRSTLVPTTSPAKGGSAADQIIGEIEERFPNWRSYRDLIDCIDCTLHDLRSALRTSAPVGPQAKEGEANG